MMLSSIAWEIWLLFAKSIVPKLGESASKSPNPATDAIVPPYGKMNLVKLVNPLTSIEVRKLPLRLKVLKLVNPLTSSEVRELYWQDKLVKLVNPLTSSEGRELL